MTRSRMPNRREGIIIPPVPHPVPGSQIEYTVKIGFDDDEKPQEIFISCNKLTTAMHTSGLEIATLVSIALQHGASFEELAAAMPREDIGMMKNMPQGAAGAVLDAVISELKFLRSNATAALAPAAV